MLRNPWIQPPPGVTSEPIDAESLPESLLALARRKLGDSFRPGFGYISAVLIGEKSVLKFDRFPGRSGRFDHDRAVSGFAIEGITVPEILDEGVTDGFGWIEQTVVPGFPAYLKWNALDETRQGELMESVGRAVGQMQKWPVDRGLLHSDYESWPAHVGAAVERAISNAEGIVGDTSLAEARERAAEWSGLIRDRDRVACHGDLWFGNVFIDPDGRLSGIIDWDRLSLAPAVYELDMVWRFWRYPWNFVPEEWEAAYAGRLDPALLGPVVRQCIPKGEAESACATLNMLELAYRLGMGRRFGWGSALQEMLDTVLSGQWADGLALN